KPAQLLRTHVSDDDADEECDQGDDRHRRDAGVIDMANDGNRPQALEAPRRPADRGEYPAHESGRSHQVAPLAHRVQTDLFQSGFRERRDSVLLFLAAGWHRSLALDGRVDEAQLVRRVALKLDVRSRLTDLLEKVAQAPCAGEIQRRQALRAD